MTIATIFAGFGGQGVLLMGYVLSHGAMLKGLNVTYFPAYGTEMRGGTANCTVVVSEKRIASPVTSHPDILVAMNHPSLAKFESSIKEGGLVFINSSLIDVSTEREDITPVSVPAGALARELVSDRQANMIMMGAVMAKTGLLSLEETQLGMKAALKGKEKLFQANMVAIERGTQYVRGLDRAGDKP
jgi:2-oxoglutarate ferredoxin oxidoreductase subunit gamma